jgi:hypothetical protein
METGAVLLLVTPFAMCIIVVEGSIWFAQYVTNRYEELVFLCFLLPDSPFTISKASLTEIPKVISTPRYVSLRKVRKEETG